MSRSSEEAPVMGGERRGRAVGCCPVINQCWEELRGQDTVSREVV